MSIKLKSTLIGAFTALILFTGCNTARKQIETLHALNAKYPNELAADCSRYFPAKDSLGKPIYIPAKNIDNTALIGLLKQKADSLANKTRQDSAKIAAGDVLSRQELLSYKSDISVLQNKINDLRALYKPCKPDTIKIPHYIVDNAMVATLTAQLRVKLDSLIAVKTQLETSKKTAATRLWWLIGLAIALGVSVVWSIYKLVKF